MIDTLYDEFKHWSKTGSVYIISDTHFDDKCCTEIDPNWPTPDSHIEILSNMCHKSDTLILLGDVGNPDYVDTLKCYKVLIMGNHDSSKVEMMKHFDEVYSGNLFISDRILLSHYPIYLPFAFTIHGHNHNGVQFEENGINVASNVIGYTPINLGKLVKSGLLKDVKDIHRYMIDNRKD